MNQATVNKFFGADHAKFYDERWRPTAPVRDALHLLTRAVFSSLPERARILCVGAGTGAEIFYLAANFPNWRFTAVEPSGPMLEVLKARAAAAGIQDRCEFHEGFLDSLPPSAPFDAATSILVSQFLTDPAERLVFFRQIAGRLRKDAPFVSADLASALEGEEKEALYQHWLRFQAGKAEVSGSLATSVWQQGVAVSKPAEVEALLAGAGFAGVLPLYQALFIHAWASRRA